MLRIYEENKRNKHSIWLRRSFTFQNPQWYWLVSFVHCINTNKPTGIREQIEETFCCYLSHLQIWACICQAEWTSQPKSNFKMRAQQHHKYAAWKYTENVICRVVGNVVHTCNMYICMHTIIRTQKIRFFRIFGRTAAAAACLNFQFNFQLLPSTVHIFYIISPNYILYLYMVRVCIRGVFSVIWAGDAWSLIISLPFCTWCM